MAAIRSERTVERETDHSKRNAALIEKELRLLIDPEISLVFFPAEGHYYLARRVGNIFWNLASQELGALVQDDETVHAHAFRRKSVVVAVPENIDELYRPGKSPHPLSVGGMENRTRTKQQIMAFLMIHDTKGLAATADERVRRMESELDSAEDKRQAGVIARVRSDMRDYAGDFYRTNVAPKIFLPGEK